MTASSVQVMTDVNDVNRDVNRDVIPVLWLVRN